MDRWESDGRGGGSLRFAKRRGSVSFTVSAGLIILTTDVVTNAKQDDYVRLAGTVSVMAFLAGYDADLFKRALDRIVALTAEPKRKP